MKKFKNKRAVIIGFGGMGKRYYKALKSLGFKISHICDKNENNNKVIHKLNFVKNYKKLLNVNADLLCIVTNTTDRFTILADFLKFSPIKRIITEKPLSCSLIEAFTLEKLIKKNKKKVIINSYRNLLRNYKQIIDILKKKKRGFKKYKYYIPFCRFGKYGISIF